MLSIYPATYSRLYKLRGNPFSPGAVVDPETLPRLFVHLKKDYILETIVTETVTGGGGGFVVFVGDVGYGRTIRLRYLQDKFRRFAATPLYFGIEVLSGPEIITSTISSVLAVTRSPKIKIMKALNVPLIQIYSKKFELHDFSPSEAGDLIVRALYDARPCALLIDNIYNIFFTERGWTFYYFEMLREVVSSLPKGVLVAMGISRDMLDEMIRRFPALESRIHEEIKLDPIRNDEALALVNRRLFLFRTGRTPSESFPFTEECIIQSNEYVKGNPLRLIKLLEKLLKMAAIDESQVIDGSYLDRVKKKESNLISLLSSVPEYLREELRFIIESFGRSPFDLEQLALLVEKPIPLLYSKMEGLVERGIINREVGGRYRLSEKCAINLGIGG